MLTHRHTSHHFCYIFVIPGECMKINGKFLCDNNKWVERGTVVNTSAKNTPFD